MIKLNKNEFKKIIPLVKSNHELSVQSVIDGIMPGEIFVNNIDNPTAALIKTSECNLIAGALDDDIFNSQVHSELDFWDMITPDSIEWINKIPSVHNNPFIRKYKRRRYELSINEFLGCDENLQEGYKIEKVDLVQLRQKKLESSEKLLQWAENWGTDEQFQKYGTGYFIHDGKVIVSWSLTDCSFEDRVAIGIHTDERYRKNGFGKRVVSANVKDCFAKGYKKIEWLCVDSNKGSIAIAEGLKFKHINDYYSFSSYPPIENLTDLSEHEWHEWGEYLEEGAKHQECLIWECLYSYIKANDAQKTIDIMKIMKSKNIGIDYLQFKDFIITLQSCGRCSNFKNSIWNDFLNENMGGLHE